MKKLIRVIFGALMVLQAMCLTSCGTQKPESAINMEELQKWLDEEEGNYLKLTSVKLEESEMDKDEEFLYTAVDAKAESEFATYDLTLWANYVKSGRKWKFDCIEDINFDEYQVKPMSEEEIFDYIENHTDFEYVKSSKVGKSGDLKLTKAYLDGNTIQAEYEKTINGTLFNVFYTGKCRLDFMPARGTFDNQFWGEESAVNFSINENIEMFDELHQDSVTIGEYDAETNTFKIKYNGRDWATAVIETDPLHQGGETISGRIEGYEDLEIPRNVYVWMVGDVEKTANITEATFQMKQNGKMFIHEKDSLRYSNDFTYDISY